MQYYKGLNNQAFGKTIEKRKRIQVKIVKTVKRYRSLIKRKNFKYFHRISENLFTFVMTPELVKLDSPIYVEFSVLESSKKLMHDFHYNYVKKWFTNAKLLLTDTDSFLYGILCTDLYKELY